MMDRKAKAEDIAALAAEVRRATREIALSRRFIMQARDQLIAVEIALSRAREEIEA